MTQERILAAGIVLLIFAIPIEFLSSYTVLLSTKFAFIIGIIGCVLVGFVIFQWLFEIFKEFVENNIYTPFSRISEHKEKIENETEYIKRNLKNDLYMPLEKLKEYYAEVKKKQFMSEVIVEYYSEWHDFLDRIHTQIQNEEDMNRKQKQDYELQTHKDYIKSLKEQAENLKQLEEKATVSEQEEFLDQYKDALFEEYPEDLEEYERQWLMEVGFKKDHQWNIKTKDNKEMLVRCRSNESPSHAYLVGAIWDYITSEGIDPDAKIYETRMPDVVFTISGFEWAIEVETGSVIQKNSKQLQEKVAMLNEKYQDRWFFVVTNKNLVSKYKQYGKVVERADVIDEIDYINDPTGEMYSTPAK